MPSREEQRRVNAAVALFSLAFGSLMVFSYVLIAISEGLLVPKAHLVADFRDAGSIGANTEVQLAGKLIGKVIDVEFITLRYPCNPQTEDFGHPYQGRTDDCEPWMFCAPLGPSSTHDPSEGVCAELEEYSGHPSDYQGCEGPAACESDHVCVTRAFRQRYRSVRWWGQAGWCVGFDSQSQRIRVDMEVDRSALQYIHTDSRASIVLNGILADPRVNITVGTSGVIVEDGARLQTTASLMEDVLALKDQIDKIADDVDRGLLGVSALTDSLNDEKTKADIAAIRENVSEIQRQVAAAEGLVGAVLNDPDTRAEMSKTLRETKQAIDGVQTQYEELERKSKRTFNRVEKAAGQIQGILDGLEDPNNTSLLAVLVNEEHGLQADGARLGDGTQEAIGAGLEAIADIDAALEEIMQAIEKREGSLGRLVADPKPLYHLKDPATLRRVNVVKSLVRWVIEDEVATDIRGDDEAAPAEADVPEP
jgi:ABC-type transporter Mla subunit MlaD